MYGKIISIKFFRMKPPLNLNLMYAKVLEIDKLYLGTKNLFKSITWVTRKIENNNFYYRKCIKMYGKCMGNLWAQFFTQMFQNDATIGFKLTYSKIVELEKLYLSTKENL